MFCPFGWQSGHEVFFYPGRGSDTDYWEFSSRSLSGRPSTLAGIVYSAGSLVQREQPTARITGKAILAESTRMRRFTKYLSLTSGTQILPNLATVSSSTSAKSVDIIQFRQSAPTPAIPSGLMNSLRQRCHHAHRLCGQGGQKSDFEVFGWGDVRNASTHGYIDANFETYHKRRSANQAIAPKTGRLLESDAAVDISR